MERWLGPLISTLGIGAMVALVVVLPPVREAVEHAVSGDAEAMRAQLRDSGTGGAGLVVAVILLHAIVFYPAELINAAAGYVYGFWLGMAIVHTAWIASGLVGFGLGRWLGRPVLRKLFGVRRLEYGPSAGSSAAGWPLNADRGAADPDRPVRGVLLRRRRRARPARPLHLDDRGRRPAAHRARRPVRHPPARARARRPAAVGRDGRNTALVVLAIAASRRATRATT